MKIKFFPYQAHCFAFGGFEVQMLSAFDALKNSKVECEKIDLWNTDSNFDIAHFWGLGLPQYENVKWAKLSGKKVVSTILLSYFEDSLGKLKFSISKKIHTQKFLFEIMQLSDKIVVVNDMQKEVCIKYYQLPENKIAIIPNIVNDIYFSKPALVKNPVGHPFILSVGNICKRKNQVALCKAVVNTDQQLVVIGKVLPGEESYGKEFKELVGQTNKIIWIQGLQANSYELFSYYFNCQGFALPSFEETQPISLLEAIACQKPILTANKQYGRQKYFQNAVHVEPGSIKSLERGIQELISSNVSDRNSRYINECLEKNVALEYKQLYETLLYN
ncbi:MAG TPA: glycosyltransferase family 4 protein [Flavisolibacter sp.]|jgi:glycosyltransferase involved in cell wall biosynthesis|nr:glycosyltransferase family 4 protein [Flavisolibacter sp.]